MLTYRHRIPAFAKAFSFVFIVAALAACNQGKKPDAVQAPRYAIIPYPQQLEERDGSFRITKETALVVTAPEGTFDTSIAQLQNLLEHATGNRPGVAHEATGNSITVHYDSTLHPEGYRLEVTPSGISFTAKTDAGLFRASQTLRQLLPPTIETSTLAEASVPAVNIADQPKYAWRGMHFDVSRHFFSLDHLRKLIDAMALYKYNKFHLHLSDDQGWRIEIKKYPKLTEAGAWRELNNQDSVCLERAKNDPSYNIESKHMIQRDGKTLYGGFYTQDEMRELIAYAAERHIDIIPEIDMPGHMMAAIKQYPYLACTSGGASWGKTFSTPICPCNEETFRFAEDVYTEIFNLFPSEYVHLGADEVEKTTWGTSAACKALMKRNNIKDLNALQSYFVLRMEKFFHAHGKKLIGWDEVLEGGVSASAVVMYWRAWLPQAPVTAAKLGNAVIMTPGNPLYFDNLPDSRSLDVVYHFNPIPKGLDEKAAANIIGAQANTWTEYIPSDTRADYMMFPRMTALSEVLWTSRQDDYEGYRARLVPHYARLDLLKIDYRLPDLEGLVQNNVFTDKAVIALKSPLPSLTLRYTRGGKQPDATSQTLTEPLTLTESDTIKVALFAENGRRGDVYTLAYEKQTFAPAQTVGSLQPGLKLLYNPGFVKNTGSIAKEADSTLTVTGIVVPDSLAKGSFGLRYRGYIDVPQQGIYNFFFTCDDGGVLRIDNRLVVDNDGLHGPIMKSGGIALDKGPHIFELDFIEGGGGFTLDLKYSTGSDAPAAVPASWWKTN